MYVLSTLFVLLIVFMLYIFIVLSIIDLCVFQDKVKNIDFLQAFNSINLKRMLDKLTEMFKKLIGKVDNVQVSIKEDFSYDNTKPLFIQQPDKINDLSVHIPSTNDLINNRVFDPKPNVSFRY